MPAERQRSLLSFPIKDKNKNKTRSETSMETKGGEVRRLHIIYFLSHMDGHAEHPHLIRVLHLVRNGVYLRDIKRWLGELRGKDLPESFAWSYKRRYKSGYVWQDLMDDDLITPISDNEYVLKGSQIHTTPFETHSIKSINEKKNDTGNGTLAEKVKVEEDKQKQQKKPSLSEEESEIQKETDSKQNNLNQGSSEISQDSLVFSSDRSSDDDSSSKVEEEKLLGNGKEGLIEKNHAKFEAFSFPSLYHNLMSKKGKKDGHNNKTDTTTPPGSTFSTPTSSTSSQSQSSFTKMRSNSTRMTSVFRNWIGCGTVETNDAAFLSMNPSQNILPKETNNVPQKRGEICKGDKLGGSARCFGTPWNYHDQNEHYGARKSCDGEEINKGRKKLSELMGQTSYKPFGGPFCSQCGKSFKPEKMHKHMKSCKGMKSMGTSTVAEESSQIKRSTTSSCKDYLLQN